MVGCLTFILLAASIIALFAFDVLMWGLTWKAGLAGLLPLIGFLIAYKYSVEMCIAPRDFWTNPDWEIAKKKLGYAWSTAGTLLFILLIASEVVS